ncbi:MAG: hypothetical protein IJV69_07415 [Kiritimatiellae bacterium]|nr:hypothetical protein [Kiritimatiellia bacterium]
MMGINPIDGSSNMRETEEEPSQKNAENTTDNSMIEKDAAEVEVRKDDILKENKELKTELKQERNEKQKIKEQLKSKEADIEQCQEELYLYKELYEEFGKRELDLELILLEDDHKERFNKGKAFLGSLKDEWCRGKHALRTNKEHETKLEEFCQTRCADQKRIKDLEDKKACLEHESARKEELIHKLQDDNRKLQEDKKTIEQTNKDLETKNQDLEKNWDGLSQGIRNSLLLRDSNVFTDDWLVHFINQALVGEEGYPKEKALSLYVALIYFVFLDNSKEKPQQSVAESIQKLGEAYMGYLHDYKRDNPTSAREQLQALAKELNARPLLKETHIELWVPSMNDVVDNSTMNCKSPTNIVQRVYNWKILMNGTTYCKALVG